MSAVLQIAGYVLLAAAAVAAVVLPGSGDNAGFTTEGWVWIIGVAAAGAAAIALGRLTRR